jgi:hypothetical protein
MGFNLLVCLVFVVLAILIWLGTRVVDLEDAIKQGQRRLIATIGDMQPAQQLAGVNTETRSAAEVIQDNRGFIFPLRLTCSSCESDLKAESQHLHPIPGGMTWINGKYLVICPICLHENYVQAPASLPS